LSEGKSEERSLQRKKDLRDDAAPHRDFVAKRHRGAEGVEGCLAENGDDLAGGANAKRHREVDVERNGIHLLTEKD
jgi:hypothetical protein